MAKNNHIDPETYKTYEIKTLPVNTLINIKEVSKKNPEKFYDDLKVGDVLTFVYYTTINGSRGQYVFTHRLIEKEAVTDGYRLTLMGDAEEASGGTQTIYTNPITAEQSFSYVLGKVTWANHPVGEVVSFLKSRNGILFLVIIPCSALFLYEIGKIIYIVIRDKKDKQKVKAIEAQEKMDSNQAEIESLKAQLAALQNEKQEPKQEKIEEEVNKKEE